MHQPSGSAGRRGNDSNPGQPFELDRVSLRAQTVQGLTESLEQALPRGAGLGVELSRMPEGPAPEHRRPALIERRIRRIADARSITFALAVTFIGLGIAGAVAIRFLDEKSFTSFGSAFWWALQTVTTVGYGDVVPQGTTGKVIGSIEMVLGVSFISFLTAGVTSAVVQRAQDRTQADQDRQMKEDTERLAASLSEIKTAIAELDQRLDRLS